MNLLVVKLLILGLLLGLSFALVDWGVRRLFTWVYHVWKRAF